MNALKKDKTPRKGALKHVALALAITGEVLFASFVGSCFIKNEAKRRDTATEITHPDKEKPQNKENAKQQKNFVERVKKIASDIEKRNIIRQTLVQAKPQEEGIMDKLAATLPYESFDCPLVKFEPDGGESEEDTFRPEGLAAAAHEAARVTRNQKKNSPHVKSETDEIADYATALREHPFMKKHRKIENFIHDMHFHSESDECGFLDGIQNLKDENGIPALVSVINYLDSLNIAWKNEDGSRSDLYSKYFSMYFDADDGTLVPDPSCVAKTGHTVFLLDNSVLALAKLLSSYPELTAKLVISQIPERYQQYASLQSSLVRLQRMWMEKDNRRFLYDLDVEIH